MTYPEISAVDDLTVVFAGPMESRFELEPNTAGRFSWSSEIDRLDSAESVLASGVLDGAPFELSACITPPPAPIGEWSDQMERRSPGEDVTLRWSNPMRTARAYLRMTTGIGTHGGISPVEIECEGPDDGELQLPGGFLDALYKAGWACGECGVNSLWRYHASQTETDEPLLQLRVQAHAPFYYRP